MLNVLPIGDWAFLATLLVLVFLLFLRVIVDTSTKNRNGS